MDIQAIIAAIIPAKVSDVQEFDGGITDNGMSG